MRPEDVCQRATFSFLRIGKVLVILGLCRSSLYNRIAAGLFVPPINLGGRAVGFPSHEVDAISAALLAGKSEDEIRTLVRKLEADRKNAAQAMEAA